MKSILKIFVAIIVILCAGCGNDDNPAAPLSIDQQINSAKPISYVKIEFSDKTYVEFEKAYYSNFKNAYADNGYLVVTTDINYFYNLNLAKQISVKKNSVYISYR
ncbi:MAG: hypothetical protein ACM3RX_10080 [Methanococcaceae archaeon]